MKRGYVLGGFICLILAGLAGAEYLSTSIHSDGSVMLATSGSDQNGSFVSRALGVDAVRLVRTVSGNDEHDLAISGSGPVLVSDVASAVLKSNEVRDRCVFLGAEGERPVGEASVYTSGILHGGEFDVSRAIGPDLSGETLVNGSGLMAFGSFVSGNRSLRSRGFVSGNLTVEDLFRFGGRI
ncbi:hypothetical protein [uncultured Methanospirillum sp.]|uniref:hypothetical protein n=1 Tax=uncultured Methanospirillum sp. TaxID=262503 RepID=UPI0029C7676E|nr:hypothetical protein [uncultured Methanospirillum sp.]